MTETNAEREARYSNEHQHDMQNDGLDCVKCSTNDVFEQAIRWLEVEETASAFPKTIIADLIAEVRRLREENFLLRHGKDCSYQIERYRTFVYRFKDYHLDDMSDEEAVRLIALGKAVENMESNSLLGKECPENKTGWLYARFAKDHTFGNTPLEALNQANFKPSEGGGMNTYTVCLAVYAEKYVKVKAKSQEEAEEIALESDDNEFSLCNYCADQFELSDSSGGVIAIEKEAE